MVYDKPFLDAKAKELRATCVRIAHQGKEGHLKGALSSIEILMALYYFFLRVDPEKPDNPDRDRFIFSKGHACVSLWAVLAERGFIPPAYLEQYAKDNSPVPSHPCKHALPILDWSSGSLGHGLGIASGIAFAMKKKGLAPRAVVLLSDGECNEGSIWESATFASLHGLDNLVCIVDYNGIQSVGRTSELFCSAEELRTRFEAFGWSSVRENGHDVMALARQLQNVPHRSGKPTVLVAETMSGAGISFMQDDVLWHYRVPSEDDVKRAMLELNKEKA